MSAFLVSIRKVSGIFHSVLEQLFVAPAALEKQINTAKRGFRKICEYPKPHCYN
jgi:hypothetical protein